MVTSGRIGVGEAIPDSQTAFSEKQMGIRRAGNPIYTYSSIRSHKI